MIPQVIESRSSTGSDREEMKKFGYKSGLINCAFEPQCLGNLGDLGNTRLDRLFSHDARALKEFDHHSPSVIVRVLHVGLFDGSEDLGELIKGAVGREAFFSLCWAMTCTHKHPVEQVHGSAYFDVVRPFERLWL